MKRKPIVIEEQIDVGRNSQGYMFAVGLIGGYWVGYALGAHMLFFFPGISTDLQLGMVDRDEAIRRVGAIAQDPAGDYGGVEEWFVDEALRGDPEAYRCPRCQEVCCGQDHQADDDAVYWEDDPPGRVCRVCGCTDLDCSQCVERTGKPCSWVEIDLCSACVGRK